MQAKLISILGVFMAALCCACGCQSKGQPTAASLYPNELVRDAWKTHAAYIKAVNAGTEKPGTDIPSAYWAKRIKALQPLYVYTHMANIVVVQHTCLNRETMDFSSHRTPEAETHTTWAAGSSTSREPGPNDKETNKPDYATASSRP
jgi:hypothetical protein